MKWILINLIVFQVFAQECTWKGLGNDPREEVTSFLIQRARAKVDAFLIEKGMVKTSEEPMVVEITTDPESRSNVASARYHYKFKTQNGYEISTDPNRVNNREQNYFSHIDFYLWTERDAEGKPKINVCHVYFKFLKIPLFNLSLNDDLLGRLELFDYTDIFEFGFPASLNFDMEFLKKGQ